MVGPSRVVEADVGMKELEMDTWRSVGAGILGASLALEAWAAGPGLPDLALHVGDLHAGDSTRVEVLGTQPGDTVYLVGAQPVYDAGACVPGTSACLGLRGVPVVLARWEATSDREVLSLPIPSAVPVGARAGLQAVVWNGGSTALLSDAVLVTVRGAHACGDGRISGSETCDDGGVAPGDGCDAVCQLEAAPLRWTQELAADVAGVSFDATFGMEALPDGGVLVLGEILDEGFPVGSEGRFNLALVRLSALGEVLWSRRIQAAGGLAYEGPQAVALSDGTFAVAVVMVGSGSVRRVALLHVQDDGSLLASTTLADANLTGPGVALAQRDDGDLDVLWGSNPSGGDRCGRLATVSPGGVLRGGVSLCVTGRSLEPAGMVHRSGASWVSWASGDAVGLARVGAGGELQASHEVILGSSLGTGYAASEALAAGPVWMEDGRVALGAAHRLYDLSPLRESVRPVTLVFDPWLGDAGGNRFDTSGTGSRVDDLVALPSGDVVLFGPAIFSAYQDRTLSWWGQILPVTVFANDEARAIERPDGPAGLLLGRTLTRGSPTTFGGRNLVVARVPDAPDGLACSLSAVTPGTTWWVGDPPSGGAVPLVVAGASLTVAALPVTAAALPLRPGSSTCDASGP